jgi:hypothetical protein
LDQFFFLGILPGRTSSRIAFWQKFGENLQLSLPKKSMPHFLAKKKTTSLAKEDDAPLFRNTEKSLEGLHLAYGCV